MLCRWGPQKPTLLQPDRWLGFKDIAHEIFDELAPIQAATDFEWTMVWAEWFLTQSLISGFGMLKGHDVQIAMICELRYEEVSVTLKNSENFLFQ